MTPLPRAELALLVTRIAQRGGLLVVGAYDASAARLVTAGRRVSAGAEQVRVLAALAREPGWFSAEPIGIEHPDRLHGGNHRTSAALSLGAVFPRTLVCGPAPPGPGWLAPCAHAAVLRDHLAAVLALPPDGLLDLSRPLRTAAAQLLTAPPPRPERALDEALAWLRTLGRRVVR